MKTKATTKHPEKRNWLLTVVAYVATAFTGWAAYICWANLQGETYGRMAIAVFAMTSLLFLMVAVSGKP